MSDKSPAPISMHVPLPRAGQTRAWWRAPGTSSGLAWAITRAAHEHDAPVLAIAADTQHAHQLENDLRTLLAGDATLPVQPLPDWETLPYDQFSPHPDIVSQRLATLHALPGLKRGIVVVPVQTLMQRLAPHRHLEGGRFDYATGQRLDLDAAARREQQAHALPHIVDAQGHVVFGLDRDGDRFDESATIQAGRTPVVCDLARTAGRPLRVGLSICYDLRFPELYRRMAPVDLIVVPSAFTYQTGRVHWEILLRARAIENQCYVLAAAQGGEHPNGRRTWGHSMLVDPWGEIIAVQAEGEAVVAGDLDLARIAEIRKALPALRHRVL